MISFCGAHGMKFSKPILLFFLVCFSVIGFADQEKNGSVVITRLNDALLVVMKNAQTLGYNGRYQMLDSVIRETHDLSRIARFSVGRPWDEMSAHQQTKFVDKFSRYSVATYVDRFNGFGGEVFKTLSEQTLPRGRVLVKALLESPEYGVVNFDYVLDQDASGAWKIINIMADGVSDLALKRAHYTDVIKKKGIDALIAELIAKTTSYSSGK
jgi:phospholipid transport system substrate-binding protein